MTSTEFAAAQERVLARRAAQTAHRQTQIGQQLESRASKTIARLPFPLSNIGQKSLIAWEAVKGREGTNPAFRVGQVDSEILDEELLELLRNQVGEGLKYFGVHSYTFED